MSINQLIFRNLKKNLKNYYLYVFALIFSVALYFAFVTLQYDPAMNETKGSIKGAAAIRAASILLVAIVSIFLLYANNIFIKRRSKEIGLISINRDDQKQDLPHPYCWEFYPLFWFINHRNLYWLFHFKINYDDFI